MSQRDPDKCYLEVGENLHQGWLDIAVQRSIEQASAQFHVGMTETWPGEANPIRVHPGDPCKVSLGDDLVISGYVDVAELAHDAKSHTVFVSGRSKTQDVVDCSCDSSKSKPAHWTNRTVVQIAEDVCFPYNVGVTTDISDLQPVTPPYVAKVGDRAFDVIEQVCREQRLLVTDTPDGKLLLTRAGSQTGPMFLHPGNILAASCRVDVSKRFTKIIVKAQTAGDDDNWGSSVAGVEDFVEDLGVIKRYRLLVIRGEKAMNKARAKARANWEAVTRAGRSCQISVTVPGWRDEHGKLYGVNQVSWVADEVIGVDANLLSISARYTLDASRNRITQFDFAPPGAYEPELARAQKAGGKAKVGLFRNASAF